MSQIDRIAKLWQMLNAQRCVTLHVAKETLQVSRATVHRDIAKLRNDMHAPIEWIPDRHGWSLRVSSDPKAVRELPGLWFTPDEIHALLTTQHLLSQIDMGGLLGPHLQPLRKRLRDLISRGMPQGADVGKYVRVAAVGARRVHLPCFQTVSEGLMRRQRLQLTHRSRVNDQTTQREVSPQRLIHYRGTWYLDAWCHAQNALRTFAVDAVESAQCCGTRAIDVEEAQLDADLGAGYGIFAGTNVQWAKLRFSAERARWVAYEHWHPDQRGHWDDDRRWVLELPYADSRELVMDILRHVPEVEVLAPSTLLNDVTTKLRVGIQTVGLGSAGETRSDEHVT